MKDVFVNNALNLKRKGMEDFLNHLEETGFFKAPASTQSSFHLAEEGGLLEHSVNVCELAQDLNYDLGTPCNMDEVIFCSLFHDIGKHQVWGKDYYGKNILKSGKQSTAKPYERNKGLVSIPHEILSLQILNQFFEVTEDEAWAILHHNGMYGDLKYSLQGKETPLQMIIHFADLWSSRVTERK